MSESQAFASLTPRLLARKGGAKPAMRRQDTSRFVPGAQPLQPDDLGWNDWGAAAEAAPVADADPPKVADIPAAAPAPAPAPVLTVPVAQEPAEGEAAAGNEMPEVLRQIEQLAWRVNQAVATYPPADVLPAGKRAAFTLRLDNERHFRLKMAGVVLNRSAQVLVTEALDKYLSEIPEVASIKGPGRVPN